MKKKTLNNLMCYGIVILAFVICQVWISGALGFKMSRSLQGQMIPICVYIVLAISLNLVVGISGELSLGHAGFMSVGAFSGCVMSGWLATACGMENEFVRLLLAMIVGGICAGIAGVIIGIPVLRLKGDYLAIVTLAFGEIIKNILNCLYISMEENGALHFAFINLPKDMPGDMIVNGPNGAVGTDKIATFLMGFLLTLFAIFVVMNLVNSSSGRAIMAIRDNRIAAESVGLNITKYKMMAFVTSAVIAGMAGALYGLNFSTIVPTKFNFNTSILILVFVVLGGIGNMVGSIIAAALLTILPELLRSFSDYRMLVYAIVLILVMLLTNNPTLRSFWTRIITKKSKDAAGGAES